MKELKSLGAVHTHTHTPILAIKNTNKNSAIFRDILKHKESKILVFNCK